MLKIQIRELAGRVVLDIDGRLTGDFVPEVRSAWNRVVAIRPGSKVNVDLKNVTCIDREGRALLRSMHGQGVKFLRAGLATEDILDEALQKQGCGE